MNDFIYFISKKIKSCNAKRGTTMKMTSRLIDLISRKTNCTCSALFLLISKKQICTCSTLFLLISKKTNLHVQHAFFVVPLPLFCTTTTLFCTTETSKFLVTHYFYGEIVVCAYPTFCFQCSCSLLFFTAAHFTLLAASISHFLTAALNFHVFLPTNFQ